MQENELEYVGFWARTVASLIDSVLVLVITFPLLVAVYGWGYFGSEEAGLMGLIKGPADFLISWVLPAIAILVFWIARQATPGKMAIGARIVDARTGEPASNAQLVGRYFSYYVAIIPFCLGLLWVAFDPRKQGWHDKLAGTVVVRDARR